MAIEDTMAQMAHSQLTQSLPTVAQDIQGFQLIHNDEEINSVTGVVVILIGNLVVYVPAIYRKGKIYNMDIMYIPEMHQWLPISDNIAVYLKSRSADLDAAIKQRENGGKGLHTPKSVDLDTPLINMIKMATADGRMDRKYIERVGISGVLKEAGDIIIEAVSKPVTDLNIPEVTETIGGAAGTAAASRILNTIANIPEVGNVFVQFYTDDDLVKLAEKASDAIKMNAAVATEAARTTKGSVKLMTAASEGAKDLSDEEKRSILRDGVVISDTRGLVPTKIYKTKNANTWATPDVPGVYELLRLDGTTLTAYVVPVVRDYKGDEPPYHHPEAGKSHVIPLDDGLSRKAHIGPEFLIGQWIPTVGMDNSFGYGVDNIPTDERELFCVDTDGSCIRLTGVELHYIQKGNDLTIRFGSDGARICGGQTYKNPLDVHVRTMVKIPAGGKLRYKGGVLYAPSSCRFFGVANTYADNDLNLATMGEYIDAVSRRERLLGLKVYAGSQGITISDDNGRTTDPLTKKAAEFDLVKHYAIPVNVAESMVKEASASQSCRYLAKIAASTAVRMSVDDNDNNDVDITTLDLNDEGKKSHMLPAQKRQLLLDAGKTGVKEVLDVTVLKLLTEDGSSVRQIQELTPKLFGAMNAVGQLLFMLRAGTSMAEAYGETRADDMEKQFAKLMQWLGDAVIVLQQGRVDSVSDLLEGPLSSQLD